MMKTKQWAWAAWCLGAVLLANTAAAQTPYTKSDKQTIDANGEYAEIEATGLGTVSVSLEGDIMGTLNVECTISGDWTDKYTVKMTVGGSTTQVSDLSAAGAWDKGSIAGCRKARIYGATVSSGSAVAWIRGIQGGGGGSSGGVGGGGDFDVATFQTTFGTNALFLGTGADNVANTQDHLAMFPYVFDGATWDRWTGAVTVSGVATAANQTTVIGHVDGIEALLGTINTAVTTLDNAISGAGFNITQVGGTAISVNTGVLDAGTIRTALATDDPSAIALSSIAEDIGTAAGDLTYIRANLGIDAQLGGTPVTSGPNLFCTYDDTSPNTVTEDQEARVRCSATGIPRSIIWDPTNERGATVTAGNELLVELGAGAAAIGEVTGVNDLPILACNLVYVGAPSADAVAISASGTTYICSIHIDAEGTVDTRIISGTGSTCGTSTTQMSPMYAFSTTTGVLGTNEGTGLGMIMKSDASEDVCIDVSGAVVNNIRITYAQF